MIARFFATLGVSMALASVTTPKSSFASDELGEPVSLRAADRVGEADSAWEESWVRAPQLHEVRNWLSMPEAQSTLPLGFYAGAELYFARPRVGEAGTFATGSDLNDDGANIQMSNFTFAYQSSPKAYVGWRSPSTGDAFQFSYWHFDDATGRNFTITEPGTGFIPLTNLAEPEAFTDVGDNISAWKTLNFNVYDIDYLKSLAFSRGRWLVTGSVGARIADVGQTTQTWVGLGSGELAQSNGKSLNFVGAGPRLTLEGRRNLGSFFSFYARGGYSLLLGSMNSTVFGNNFIDSDFITLADNRDRTVTVTEIEIGASWLPFDNLVVSAGWLFQSWTGLESSVGETVVVEGSQNISFDGLVARAILSF